MGGVLRGVISIGGKLGKTKKNSHRGGSSSPGPSKLGGKGGRPEEKVEVQSYQGGRNSSNGLPAVENTPREKQMNTEKTRAPRGKNA